jgi:hypothetical protein
MKLMISDIEYDITLEDLNENGCPDGASYQLVDMTEQSILDRLPKTLELDLDQETIDRVLDDDDDIMADLVSDSTGYCIKSCRFKLVP